MRQRLTIILTFVVIIGVLVLLNTITHVQEEKLGDTEITANRSTYHSGPTGTRALHDFLNESGYKVMRWREATSELLNDHGKKVSTFVVVGETRIPLEDEEYALLRRWVALGGRLVIVDRSPAGSLMSTAGWTIATRDLAFPSLDTNPGDVKQMTQDVTELKPVQPTLITNNVGAVMPSRFASRMLIRAVPEQNRTTVFGEAVGGAGPPPPAPSETPVETPSVEPSPDSSPDPSPAADASPQVSVGEAPEEEEYEPAGTAPVVHFGDREGAVVVDYVYGAGRVVFLSDPYVVTNSGLRLKDNLTLAINVLGGPSMTGLIAFDEYHQGRGITRNAFASYFAGTPVLAMAGQIVLLVLVVLWTNGRRFGRPLPLAHVDRRSSLEFVASMAELQERSRAFDLAIENIYSRTRRVLARHAGVDYNSSRSEIAERIAARSTIDRHELETLMRQCEDAINGAPINWRQSLNLVRRLREVERNLGLRMRSRDVRQAAEHI